MPIKTVTDKITRLELAELAKAGFGDMVKAVVDIEKNIMVVGAEFHADEETLLLEAGSSQDNLWGINIYPEESGERFIEFDSMINIRPRQGNRSRIVIDSLTRERIIKTVKKLVT